MQAAYCITFATWMEMEQEDEGDDFTYERCRFHG